MGVLVRPVNPESEIPRSGVESSEVESRTRTRTRCLFGCYHCRGVVAVEGKERRKELETIDKSSGKSKETFLI